MNVVKLIVIYGILTVIFVSTLVFLVRKLVFFLLPRIRKIPVIARFIDDKIFRGRIGFYAGGMANILFIIFYFCCGIYYGSIWFVSIAVFYIALVFFKKQLAMVEHIVRKDTSDYAKLTEKTAYVKTGLRILVLTGLILGIGLQVILENKAYGYNQFIIYGVGAYSFFYLGLTIYNLVFFNKCKSYIWSSVQALNLVSAVLGIFTYQTAIIAMNGGKGGLYYNVMSLILMTIVLILKSVQMLVKGVNMI